MPISRSAARSAGGFPGYKAPAAPSGLPSWVSDLDIGEWVSVPTSNGIGDVAYGTSPGGTVNGITNAWGCIATDASGNVYFFGGGHADYAGNEIYKLALDQASPTYSRLNDPTASVTTNVGYYGDGKPSSRHTYQNLWVRGDELICTGGSGLWGSGSVDPEYTDIFDLTDLTWTTQVAAGGKRWVCGDRATTDVFGVRVSTFNFEYDEFTTGNSWGSLGPGGGTLVDFATAVYDVAHERIWRIGGWAGAAAAEYYEIGSGGADPTLTGTAASEFDSAPQYTGLDYDVENDTILLKESTGATVYRLNCGTFACDTMTTSGATPGDATNGVNGRFKYVPNLKGFIYVPSWGNAYFLRTA